MGRKEAAREIFMSSDRIIKHVLGYRGTDPVVRARLGKLFASSRARETREKILKERRRWGR
jgi:hypothetical protein